MYNYSDGEHNWQPPLKTYKRWGQQVLVLKHQFGMLQMMESSLGTLLSHFKAEQSSFFFFFCLFATGSVLIKFYKSKGTLVISRFPKWAVLGFIKGWEYIVCPVYITILSHRGGSHTCGIRPYVRGWLHMPDT